MGKQPLREGHRFFQRPEKIVLRTAAIIDPLNIREYIAAEGYRALANVLAKGDKDWVIDQMKKSGLRGRGGAGFPTWLKWDLTRKSAGSRSI